MVLGLELSCTTTSIMSILYLDTLDNRRVICVTISLTLANLNKQARDATPRAQVMLANASLALRTIPTYMHTRYYDGTGGSSLGCSLVSV
jgi:hypothetical protein